MQEQSFFATFFGKALSGTNERTDPMTRDNITQAEEMALNQVASDDKIICIVNDAEGTTSSARPNGRHMSLGDALNQRINDLEVLKEASERAQKEGYGEPQWSSSNQYDLDFYKTLSENPRFSELEISDCVNYASSATSEVSQEGYTSYTKMAAFRFPADDTRYVSYAGTGPEVTSWLENGRMATTQTGVQAQKAASEYLNQLMKVYDEDIFIVAGYSKGGNEALYAGIMLDSSDKERLYRLNNFDGPGFGNEILENEEFIRKYNELKNQLGDELYCLSPQNSVVGHLMDNHDTYCYFQSSDEDLTSGFLAHDYKNWRYDSNGNLEIVDADGNPLQRTRMSEFYEGLLEDLLAELTPEETERFYDMLEKLCVDNNIVTLDELNKLCVKDGRFDFDTLCNAVVSFTSSLDAKDMDILVRIVETTITAESLSYMIELEVEYLAKAGGFEWNELLQKGMNALEYQVLDIEKTAAAIKVMIAGITALIVGASTIYVGVKWVKESIETVYQHRQLSLSDLCEKFQAGLDSIWASAEQMIERIKNTLTKTTAGIFQDVQKILAASNAVEVIRISLQQSKEAFLNTADVIGQTVQTVLFTTMEKIDKGFQTVGSFFDSIFDCCKILFRNTKNLFVSKVSNLGIKFSRGVTLGIDADGLAETVRLLNKAAQHAAGLSSRVSNICRRLTTEGVVDAYTGNFRTLASTYHLVITHMQVNHYEEIVSMARKVEGVRSAYEGAKREIHSEMPELY